MQTIDDIEYDHEVLKAKTVEQLLYQLICLKHLDRPNRVEQMAAKAYYEGVVAKTLEYLIDVKELGVPVLHEALHEGLLKYQEAVKAVGLK